MMLPKEGIFALAACPQDREKALAFKHNLRYPIPVRVFKNTWFARFADKEEITDDELTAAVNRLEAGQFDANLGGGVYKVKVARPGEGKLGGYRVIVFFRSEERTFFEYGFAKSDRDNISERELRSLKKKAKKVFSLTDEEIRDRLRKRFYIEIL